jgi:hypothetical protein
MKAVRKITLLAYVSANILDKPTRNHYLVPRVRYFYRIS